MNTKNTLTEFVRAAKFVYSNQSKINWLPNPFFTLTLSRPMHVKKSTWFVKYSILKCSFSHPDYTVGLGVTPSPPVI
jgi:hypothetical protein